MQEAVVEMVAAGITHHWSLLTENAQLPSATNETSPTHAPSGIHPYSRSGGQPVEPGLQLFLLAPCIAAAFAAAATPI